MAGCNFWGHEVDPIGLVLAKTLTLVGELNIIFCALVKPLLKSHWPCWYYSVGLLNFTTSCSALFINIAVMSSDNSKRIKRHGSTRFGSYMPYLVLNMANPCLHDQPIHVQSSWAWQWTLWGWNCKVMPQIQSCSSYNEATTAISQPSLCNGLRFHVHPEWTQPWQQQDWMA